MEAKRRYIHYLIKNGKYSAEFEAETDHQAKLITKRIHGNQGDNVALFRICSPNKIGERRLKGIQL